MSYEPKGPPASSNGHAHIYVSGDWWFKSPEQREEFFDTYLLTAPLDDWLRGPVLAILSDIRTFDTTTWTRVKLRAREGKLFIKDLEAALDAYDCEHPIDDRRLRLPPEDDAPPTRDTPAPTERPVIVTMDEVEAKPVDWLWWPYLAIGKIAMIDGDPGLGKSLLTLQLAANLSRGNPMPDQQGKPTLPLGAPASTLLLTAEDGLEDTIRPRLDAAGADASKVHVLTGWIDSDDNERFFTLEHLDVLKQALELHHPRLVCIDPIQAYIGRIDIHRANETRPLLAALSRLAEAYQASVVCVRHPSKPGQGGGKAIHRGLGSIDFIGAARTGLYVEAYPSDANKVLLAPSKSNIGPLGRTQVFSKSEGQFRWVGVTRLTADMLTGSGRGPDPLAFLEAALWLEETLGHGYPIPAKEMFKQAAEEEGIKPDTLKRAKKALGIQSRKQGDGWDWSLSTLTPITPPITTASCTSSISCTSSTSSDLLMDSIGCEDRMEVEQDEQEEEEGQREEVEAVVKDVNIAPGDPCPRCRSKLANDADGVFCWRCKWRPSEEA